MLDELKDSKALLSFLHGKHDNLSSTEHTVVISHLRSVGPPNHVVQHSKIRVHTIVGVVLNSMLVVSISLIIHPSKGMVGD